MNDRKRAAPIRVHVCEEFNYHYDRDVIYNRYTINVHLLTSLAVIVGDLLRTAGEFIFGWWYVTTIFLTAVLVVMAGHIIQFLINPAGKYERR